jgi:hypothetical protein
MIRDVVYPNLQYNKAQYSKAYCRYFIPVPEPSCFPSARVPKKDVFSQDSLLLIFSCIVVLYDNDI